MIRRTPPVVVVFSLLFVVKIGDGLARSHNRGVAAVATVILLLWLAAIVVWRKRWAWLLMLLLIVAVLVSPSWEEWGPPLAYASNVVILALLVSPGMLRWVGARRWHHRAAST